MISAILSYRRLSRTQRKLVWESVIELGKARWRIKFKAFHRWQHRLGHPMAVDEHYTILPPNLDTHTQDIEEQADELGNILRKVARNVPFKANCLPQAAAAQSMLRRRGINKGIVYLGGRKSAQEHPLELHAWLYVGSICVTGNDGPGTLESFKPLVKYTLSEAEA